MIRGLQKRLRKLESSRPREQTEEQKLDHAVFGLQVAAIAFYLGDPKPNEPQVAALARALGYAQLRELLEALKRKAAGRDDPELDQKYRCASLKLFAKFEVNLKTADGGKFSEALKRMHAGLPESYKERLATPS